MSMSIYKITLSNSLFIWGESKTLEIVLIFERCIMFCAVYRLIKMTLLLSLAMITVERDFSVTKIIKTKLRNEISVVPFWWLDDVLHWSRDIQKSWSIKLRKIFKMKVVLCHFLELLYIIKASLWVCFIFDQTMRMVWIVTFQEVVLLENLFRHLRVVNGDCCVILLRVHDCFGDFFFRFLAGLCAFLVPRVVLNIIFR
jgi:hypothetical protein